MRLSALDLSDKEIAVVLSISPHTLRTHISRLYRRLGVRSRAAAVALWILAGQPGLSQQRCGRTWRPGDKGSAKASPDDAGTVSAAVGRFGSIP
jgi:hypothetical protein